MILSEDKWHTRLYVWTRIQLHYLGHHEEWDRRDNEINHVRQLAQHTNLCQYIRTLVVYLPLMVLGLAGWALWMVYATVLFPLQYIGVGHWIGDLLYIAMVAGLLGGAIAGQVQFGLLTLPFRTVKMVAVYAYEQCSAGKADGTPGLCTLALQWVADRHDHICRIIEIR